MQLKLILSAIAVVIVLGVSISAIPEDNTIPENNAIHEDSTIQREKIRDFSYFPMPTLPSAKILDNTILVGAAQDSEYATSLGNGHNLIAIKQDPFYDEITLFYATTKIQKNITNNDSIQDLVRKGVIVFDYEKIDNLVNNRIFDNKPIFMTRNSNPVYTDFGLKGKYFTIPYFDKDIRLSVYSNNATELGKMIQFLDL